MRKVKFISNRLYSNQYEFTIGQIYDVIEHHLDTVDMVKSIILIDNYGVKQEVFLFGLLGESTFIDVTTEIRNDTINFILS